MRSMKLGLPDKVTDIQSLNVNFERGTVGTEQRGGVRLALDWQRIGTGLAMNWHHIDVPLALDGHQIGDRSRAD